MSLGCLQVPAVQPRGAVLVPKGAALAQGDRGAGESPHPTEKDVGCSPPPLGEDSPIRGCSAATMPAPITWVRGLSPTCCWTPAPLCTLLVAAVTAAPAWDGPATTGATSHCHTAGITTVGVCGAQPHDIYHTASGLPTIWDVIQTHGMAPSIGTTLAGSSSSWNPP